MKKCFSVLVLSLILLPAAHAQDEPQDSPAFTRLGIMTIRAGKTEEGLKHLDKAIKLDPGNSLAYFWRGKANASMANYDEALEDFDTVIQLDPDEPTAYIERANIRKLLGNEEGAKADMDKAAKLNPQILRPVKDIKIIKSEEKPSEPRSDSPTSDPKPAIKPKGKEISLTDRMGKLIDLSIDNVIAEKYFHQGLAKFELGHYPDAVALLDKAVEHNSKFAEAYMHRARAIFYEGSGKLGRTDEKYVAAVKDLNKALDLNPRLTLAYITRGSARYMLKDYQGAKSDAEQALKLNPTMPLYLRANAKYMLDDYKGTLEDATKAIQKNPKHAEAYGMRAKAKYKLKDYKGTVQDYETALKLKPALQNQIQPVLDAARKLAR